MPTACVNIYSETLRLLFHSWIYSLCIQNSKSYYFQPIGGRPKKQTVNSRNRELLLIFCIKPSITITEEITLEHSMVYNNSI